ncbi:MAG: hypothetical protein ACP5ME_15030 [Anaerolineae bacterium]
MGVSVSFSADERKVFGILQPERTERAGLISCHPAVNGFSLVLWDSGFGLSGREKKPELYLATGDRGGYPLSRSSFVYVAFHYRDDDWEQQLHEYLEFMSQYPTGEPFPKRDERALGYVCAREIVRGAMVYRGGKIVLRGVDVEVFPSPTGDEGREVYLLGVIGTTGPGARRVVKANKIAILPGIYQAEISPRRPGWSA